MSSDTPSISSEIDNPSQSTIYQNYKKNYICDLLKINSTTYDTIIIGTYTLNSPDINNIKTYFNIFYENNTVNLAIPLDLGNKISTIIIKKQLITNGDELRKRQNHNNINKELFNLNLPHPIWNDINLLSQKKKTIINNLHILRIMKVLNITYPP
jgi:hypothetical protein